jgi:hypothetical protein
MDRIWKTLQKDSTAFRFVVTTMLRTSCSNLKIDTVIGELQSSYKDTLPLKSYMDLNALSIFVGVCRCISVQLSWPFREELPENFNLGDKSMGSTFDFLTGALVSDEGDHRYYASEEAKNAGWRWEATAAEFPRGHIIRLRDAAHFDCAVEAPELLPFLNSPCWPAGWRHSRYTLVADRVSCTNLLATFAVFDASDASIEAYPAALPEDDPEHNPQHSLVCGSVVEYNLESDADTRSYGIVTAIRVRRASEECAKTMLETMIDMGQAIAASSDAAGPAGTSAALSPEELVGRKAEAVEYFARAAPSVTLLVLKLKYARNVIPERAAPLAEYDPAKVGKEGGLDYDDLFDEVRCMNILDVKKEGEDMSCFFTAAASASLTQYEARRLAAAQDNQVPAHLFCHVDVLLHCLPLNILAWVAEFIVANSQIESLATSFYNTSPGRLQALDTMRQQLGLAVDEYWPSPRQLEFFTRTMHLSSQDGYELTRFHRHWALFDAVYSFHRSKPLEMMLRAYIINNKSFNYKNMAKLSRDEKIKILLLYRCINEAPVDTPAASIKVQVDQAWTKYYQFGNCPDIP